MFVALRQMMEQLPSGEVCRRLPGEELVTFSDWPYQNKVSALTMRLVAKVEKGGETNPERLLSRPPNPDWKAQVDEEHGWDKRPTFARLPPGLQSEPEPVTTPTGEAPSSQDQADELLMKEDPELAAALGLGKAACSECSYRGTEQGLKIHRARAHKKG